MKPATRKRNLSTDRPHATRSYWSSYKSRGSPKWRPPSPGDAAKAHYDTHDRRTAQRLLYRLASKAQRAAARLAGAELDAPPKAALQLSALYCENYPARAAAQAAVGHTAFLEYRALCGERSLGQAVRQYVEDPTVADGLDVDAAVYKQVAKWTADAVHARLVFEEMSREPHLEHVEAFRLFSAAQQSVQFNSLPEIMRAAVLYGDVLPTIGELGLHPFSEAILEDLVEVSDRYLSHLGSAPVDTHPLIALDWVNALCDAQAPFLPPTGGTAGEPAAYDGSIAPRDHRFAKSTSPAPRSVRFPPLASPGPPALQFQSPIARAMAPLSEATKALPDDSALKQLTAGPSSLLMSLDQARARDNWADIRPDTVQESLQMNPFAAGPVEGDPTDGHELGIEVDGCGQLSGEIYDRTLSAPEHAEAEYQELLRQASPVAASLRKLTYLNLEQQTETERFQTNGSLDPSRLPLADVTDCVFKRSRVRERVDRRGSPVLCILSDSSGSVSNEIMRVVKLLTAAWLMATKGSRVQVLAGLYNTGQARRGVSGPLLRWLCHPKKAPQTRHSDALRALAAAPKAGSGSQADALSLQHAINEAQRLARGRHVYVVHISDGSWIKSYSGSISAEREIVEVLNTKRQELGDRLHVTQVLVGNKSDDGATRAADNVLRLEQSTFNDPNLALQRINAALGPIMRERSRRAARG